MTSEIAFNNSVVIVESSDTSMSIDKKFTIVFGVGKYRVEQELTTDQAYALAMAIIQHLSK